MGKKLITGITGTLGKQVTGLLLEDGHEVLGYSRDEFKHCHFPNKNDVVLYLGDVRDQARLVEASRDVDTIFHFAALKHVDILEACPEEGVKTNIYGTESVLHAQRVNKIPRVVLASTDKSCLPINLYGMTKGIAERLVMRNPNNVVCRYGNVISSRGSVVPEFIKTITEDNVIKITDRRMTRFWIKPSDAAVFVYLQSQSVLGGLKIPKMQAYPVASVGLLIGEILGKKPNIVEIGMRAGEKIHEDLRTNEEGGHMNSGNRENWFSEKDMRNILKEVMETL